MGISDYLEKLRSKPARKKEQIAVIATLAAALVVLGIWAVTFSENTKVDSGNQNLPEISDQLEDLKANFGEDKKSIQDMMQGLQQNEDTSDSQLGNGNSAVENQNYNEMNFPFEENSPKKDNQNIPQLP